MKMDMDMNSVADEFFVNLTVQTTMALPKNRETILHFFEAVQKEFPRMAGFYHRETGEFTLEGDRESGAYPWVEISSHRLAAGWFNPDGPEQAYHLHRWLLRHSVYYLGLSGLDIEAQDLLFGFNFEFRGNRDEIAARALLSGSALGSFALEIGGQCTQCEPGIVIALDEECYLQARLAVETRCSGFQVRTGEYENEPISVYLTIRAYPRPNARFDIDESFNRQRRFCEDLARRTVIPRVIQPIVATIATAG